MNIIYEDFIHEDKEFYKIQVTLPKTTLLVIGNEVGYFMCGALDVEVFKTEKLKAREVVCGKALGVRTLDELFNAKLVDISDACKKYNIHEGMLVKDALLLIS